MASAFIAMQQLTSKWDKADPRYTMSVAEQIDATKKVTLADIKKFYKDFVGAGHGELSVVGDFDAAAISAQIEKHTEKWQTRKPYKRLAEKAFGVPGTTKSIDIKDKEMTTLGMAHDFAMKDTDADYPAMLMLSQVLGGDTGSRMWMRLREKEGLSYGVGSFVQADSFEAVGGFGAFAIVAPQNLEKAKAGILEEYNKMISSKVTDDELRRAKDGWIKEHDTSLGQDGYVLQMLSNQTFRKRTNAFSKELRAKIQAVTAADIERVAKKYLDAKRLVIVDAGDQAKAAAAAKK